MAEKKRLTVKDLEPSENEEIIAVVAENHQELLDEFNYPCGLQKPRVYKSVAPLTGQETAFFSFEDRGTAISEQMRGMVEPMGLKEGFKSLQEHEMGHWTGFPRDTTSQLYLLEASDRHFQGNDSVYRFYSDIANEMMRLESGRGDRLVRLRESIVEDMQGEIEGMRKAGAPESNITMMEASLTIHKLMCNLYARSFDGVDTSVTLTPEEEVHMEKLLSKDGREGICFINTRQITESAWENDLPRHEYSLIRFGKVLQDIIPDLDYQEGEDGEGQPQPGKGGKGYPQGRPRSGTGDHPGIRDMPLKDIDKALDDIIGKYGKKRFERIRDFVKKNRPDWSDKSTDGRSGKQAGMGKGDFRLHDGEIPYYARWASNFPCFIVKQPIKTDKTAHFRSGYREMEAGDPMQRVDIIRSQGMPVPGVGKVYLVEEGRMPSREFLVPNLLVGIDSSGSMLEPTRKASHVLGSFILGENYHANGSKVGGYNFSTDIVFLAPTDDLFLFQSLMCGYWGGGTYLNIDRMKEFMATMPEAERDRFHFTTDDDWRRFAERMDPRERKRFEDKNLELDVGRLDFSTRETKLDHVMFTDGYVGNVVQVVNYISP